MRMLLKIFCENQISYQFPNTLESFTLIIFQLKPSFLFYASNLQLCTEKKISCGWKGNGKENHFSSTINIHSRAMKLKAGITWKKKDLSAAWVLSRVKD